VTRPNPCGFVRRHDLCRVNRQVTRLKPCRLLERKFLDNELHGLSRVGNTAYTVSIVKSSMLVPEPLSKIRSPDPPESGMLAWVRSADPQCTSALLIQ
ncbi:hypothetical protein ACLOJK_004430, partial [Asimina triloba]